MVNLTLRHERRGTVAVEMALLLPLLLLILFGMLEYGSLFWRAQQIGAVSRQGARIGAMPSGTSAAVTSAVDTMMTNYGLGGTGYSVTLNPADPAGMAAGASFTVTISVPYTAIQLTNFPVPTPTTLVRATTMVKEGT